MNSNVEPIWAALNVNKLDVTQPKFIPILISTPIINKNQAVTNIFATRTPRKVNKMPDPKRKNAHIGIMSKTIRIAIETGKNHSVIK